MSSIPDPIREGLARGWKVRGGPHGALPAELACDVAIVGTGAGAGITAELLTAAGLSVVLIEEGPLRSSSDFRQLEADAYPQLYQESAGRRTADKAVHVLQGRCVGGGTTVNWTSSFRTPDAVLAHWAERFGLSDFAPAAMAPWFDRAERRLRIGPWEVSPNANNETLRAGAAKLGVPTRGTPRNVHGCWNLGSCGLGCPTNAKQSMLVTTIPAALDRGATLLVQARAERLVVESGAVRGVECVPVLINSERADGPGTRVSARHVVVAGGAINSPALLLRSKAPDPHGALGKRTFIHPNVGSAAVFGAPVEGWNGAPQTVYSYHFANFADVSGRIGFKLDAVPLHPAFSYATFAGFGPELAAAAREFPRTQALAALFRDGCHPDSPGGRVTLRDDGSPVLDYPLTPYFWEGARRAFLAMAEIQFAAGARSVTPIHESARAYASWAEAREAIVALPMVPFRTRVVTAHPLGGCGMAASAEIGVVRPDGRHWQLDNLSVHDGSLFPTGIGTNPQLTIYGIVSKLATRLARDLSGREVSFA
jgi:choline dehydrogenase-like flavoprotein